MARPRGGKVAEDLNSDSLLAGEWRYSHFRKLLDRYFLTQRLHPQEHTQQKWVPIYKKTQTTMFISSDTQKDPHLKQLKRAAIAKWMNWGRLTQGMGLFSPHDSIRKSWLGTSPEHLPRPMGKPCLRMQPVCQGAAAKRWRESRMVSWMQPCLTSKLCGTEIGFP